MQVIDVVNKLPWNTNGVRWKTRKLSQIKNIVIHQALGTKTAVDTNKFCITNSPNMSIGRSMPHIAYHFFIEPNGSIYRCNLETDVTSHVKNKNTSSIAICLGGFYNYYEGGILKKSRDGNPPAKQMDSLRWLTDQLIKKLNLTPKDVYTHDMLQGKPACPGYLATNFVSNLRKNYEKVSKSVV